MPLPELLDDRLTLLASETVEWEGGTGLAALYRTGDGKLVSLFAAEAPAFEVTWPRGAVVDGHPTVFWQSGPYAYALSGGAAESSCSISPSVPCHSPGRCSLPIRPTREFPMAEPFARPYATARWASQAEFDEGLRKHMLQVYNFMMLGLALTGVVAYVVGSTPALYMPIFGTPLKWVVMLAPLAFVFFFTFRIQSMSASTAQATFWAFCAVMGLSMASIFLVFTGASIARVFFITAAMFGAASLYGYTTKADLTGWARSCSWA